MRPVHALPANGNVVIPDRRDRPQLSPGDVVLLRERASVRYATLLSGIVIGVCRPHRGAEDFVRVRDGAGLRTYRVHDVGHLFVGGHQNGAALSVTEARNA